jgi:transposase
LDRTELLRVCLEASGNYSLDLALALHAHRQVEVRVVNPRRARKFAESLGERSKTDPVDARVMCQYAARMPFEVGSPRVPSLCACVPSRAIESLGVMHTQESNRAHALGSSQALPALVLRERERHQRYLEKRMNQLRSESRRLMARDAKLDRRFRLMLTVPGIGEISALQILGELVVLSDRTDARQ